MNGRRVASAFVLGVAALAVVVAVVVALGSTPKPETTAPGVAGAVGVILGVIALVATALRGRGDPGPDAEPAPWTESGRIVDRPPEETPDDVTVSGTDAAGVFAAASDAARTAGDVESGLREVRPLLRESLGAALVAGGRDPGDVERALASGSWTDDRLAAAALDDSVAEPRRTFRERLRDWFFPERAVRERTRRAVAAIDAAAGDELPAVVGEEAPRTVPVVAPTLEDLQRTADGRLQRAEAVGDGGRRGRNARDSDSAPNRDTAGAGASDATAGAERVGGDGPGGNETGDTEGDTDDAAGGTDDAGTGAGIADWGDVRGGGR